MVLTLHWIFTVIAFAFVMLITPGPNNILMANSGATHGFKKTVPIIAGVVLGPLAIFVLLAVGGLAVLKFVFIRDALRLICFVYVLYLAYKISISKPPGVDSNLPSLSFSKMLALQWVNPKVWIQYIVVLSLYTNAKHDYTAHVLIIAGLFFVLSILTACAWTLLGKVIARYLTASIHYHIFNAVMAGLLLLAVIPSLFEHL